MCKTYKIRVIDHVVEIPGEYNKEYKDYSEALNAIEEIVLNASVECDGAVYNAETEEDVEFVTNKGQKEVTPIIPISGAGKTEEEIAPKEEEKMELGKEEEEDKEDDEYAIYEELGNYIKSELDKRAETDDLFANTYAKKNKSIKECIKYVVGEAFGSCKRNGNVGVTYFSPDKVVEMAIHYYDEDDIKIKEIGNKAKPYKPTTTTTLPPLTGITKPTTAATTTTTTIKPPLTARQKKAEAKKKAEEAVISMFDDSFFE